MRLEKTIMAEMVRELANAGAAEVANGRAHVSTSGAKSGRLDTRGRTVITPRGFPLYL